MTLMILSEESGVQSEIYSSDIEDNSTSEEDYQGEYSETEYNDNTENVALTQENDYFK